MMLYLSTRPSTFFQKTFRAALITLILCLVGGGAGLLGLYLWFYYSSAQNATTEVIFEIKKGETLDDLASQLHTRGVIGSEFWYKVAIRLFSDYKQYKAGLYRLPIDPDNPATRAASKVDTITPQYIDQMVKNGYVYEPIILKFNVPEGATYRDMANRLIELGYGSKAEYQRIFKKTSLLEKYNVQGAMNLEGFIYPATYTFRKRLLPEAIVQKALETFFEKLPPDYEEQVVKMGISLYQAIIFASLIEKETSIDAEKPMVAEVIWNRLNDNAALGIDASIIYGISGFDGRLTWKHLRDKSNLYNSRIHRGLPPSPIASPALSSLLAVLKPTDEGHYFYVADPKKPGWHIFTKTLKDHNKHVKNLVDHIKKRDQQ